MNQDDWMNLLSGIGGNSTAPRRPHVFTVAAVSFPKARCKSKSLLNGEDLCFESF